MDNFKQYFKVSHETIDKLKYYEAELRKWQKAINLVAASSLDDIWGRHFADSAGLTELVAKDLAALDDQADSARKKTSPASKTASPAQKTVSNNQQSPPFTLLDLGSGAGFPALVLAIMLQDERYAGLPALNFVLVESVGKKTAFLKTITRQLNLPVEIFTERIEELAKQYRLGDIQFITSRALADLPRLLELGFPFLSPSTICLFPKGRRVEAEIEAARKGWQFSHEVVPVRGPSGLSVDGGCILRVTHVRKSAAGEPGGGEV